MDLGRHRLLATSIAGIVAACTPLDESTAIRHTLSLDVHRSLIVTDQVILDPTFSFQAVMDQIVTSSGSNTTSLELFQQLWSTLNPGPGTTPHCDDETTGGVPSFNGFPWGCPRAEGVQANTNPFTPAVDNPDGYVPIALTNRFDLAPANGAHCGEYRIIFAKASGITTNTKRNLIIFEAVLPNPDRDRGLEACRPVAQFWADLSAVDSVDERRLRLLQFYFQGLPGFKPVIHADHFGGRITKKGHGVARGQIRSNQFMQGPWLLREWRLVRDTRCDLCKLRMVPTTVKTNPWGALFDPRSTDDRGTKFRSNFVKRVDRLIGNELSGLSFDVEDEFNTGQSAANGPENNYVNHFLAGEAASPEFSDAIAAKLAQLGSSLTPRDVVARAMTQSCAGCHRLSDGADLGEGLFWPASPIRFVHVTEFGGAAEQGPDGPRWPISAGLRNEFLPHRATVLQSFLATPPGGTGSHTSASLFAPILNLVVLTVAEAQDAELADLSPSEQVVSLGIPDPVQCVLNQVETTTADLVPIEQLDRLTLPTLGGNSVH